MHALAFFFFSLYSHLVFPPQVLILPLHLCQKTVCLFFSTKIYVLTALTSRLYTRFFLMPDIKTFSEGKTQMLWFHFQTSLTGLAPNRGAHNSSANSGKARIWGSPWYSQPRTCSCVTIVSSQGCQNCMPAPQRFTTSWFYTAWSETLKRFCTFFPRKR